MTKKIDELLTEFQTQIQVAAEARKKMFEIGVETFNAYLQHIFDTYEKLDVDVIKGWTPGFNDGDPCRHHTDILISADDHFEYGRERDALRLVRDLGLAEVPEADLERHRDFTDAERDERQAKIMLLNAGLSEDAVSKIHSVLCDFDEVLEREYD